MIRRCEPLFDGDTREVCGARFDDLRRMAVCPHVKLDGGDTVGVPADTDYLVSIGARTAVTDRDPPALSPDLVAYLQRSEGVVHRTDTRYALVDVLDLAVLLQTAHGQDKYDGAVLDRVEKAPLATVPCTIKLNGDGGVWITPDPPAPDPRQDFAGSKERFTHQALPLLEDFDSDGHHSDCEARASRFALSPNVAPCTCPARLLRVANAWRTAMERQPARMTFVPADDDRVRTYGLYPAASPSEVVAFLNGHRECQPVAVWPRYGTPGLTVLYVQVRS